jgi:hypothetical protein
MLGLNVNCQGALNFITLHPPDSGAATEMHVFGSLSNTVCLSKSHDLEQLSDWLAGGITGSGGAENLGAPWACGSGLPQGYKRPYSTCGDVRLCSWQMINDPPPSFVITLSLPDAIEGCLGDLKTSCTDT